MLERKGYVYRFISMDNSILYVGKTVAMDRRMKQHFSSKSHLAHTDLYSKVQRIEYLKLPNEFEALKHELYFINKHKPRYNTDSKIKQLIEHDPTIKTNWKTYKVIKEMPREQQLQNDRLAKWLPVAMALFFISIIGMYFI